MALPGYWILTTNNRLLHFTSESGQLDLELSSDAVAIASTRDGQGCLALSKGGEVEAIGTARSLGDLSAISLTCPAVDITATPVGVGYWIIDAEGSVFSCGIAPFLEGIPQVSTGSARAFRIEAAPDGNGYWIVDERGAVYCFGSAEFHGTLSDFTDPDSVRVVDFAVTPRGDGYFFLTSDGDLYPAGGAAYLGSPTQWGRVDAVGLLGRDSGYLVVDSRGAVMVFGDVANFGSPVGLGLSVRAVA